MGQPGNTLINFLGLTTQWEAPASEQSLTGVSSHFFIILKHFVYIISKIGFVYASHLFYLQFFFLKELLFTLPVDISKKTFYKFYRVGTVSNASLNIKQTYIMRIGLKKIQFSNIYLFNSMNWVFIYFLTNSLDKSFRLYTNNSLISYNEFLEWSLFLIFKYASHTNKFRLLNFF